MRLCEFFGASALIAVLLSVQDKLDYTGPLNERAEVQMPSFRLSDVAALVDQVRGLSRVTAAVMGDKTIIHFEIGGEKGWLRLKADEGLYANESRARAAARTQMGGAPPKNMAEVRSRLARGVGPRALKILLNPDAYTVIGAHWRDIAYGSGS